jgi:hypothetical protein
MVPMTAARLTERGESLSAFEGAGGRPGRPGRRTRPSGVRPTGPTGPTGSAGSTCPTVTTPRPGRSRGLLPRPAPPRDAAPAAPPTCRLGPR